MPPWVFTVSDRDNISEGIQTQHAEFLNSAARNLQGGSE